MATKPTLSNVRFGETAGGSTVGANLTSPSSGLRDTGFQPSTPAVAAYVNWLAHEAYLWFKYVDEGVLSGTVTVDDLHVLDDVDIDDDLNVDGDTTTNTLTVNTTISVTSTRTITIGAPAMQPRNDSGLGATVGATPEWIHNTSGASAINVPIQLPIGARIVTATWYGAKTSATGTITVNLRRFAKNGTGDALVSLIGSNNTNNPGNISIPSSTINHTIAGGYFYYISILTSGQAGDYTYACDVVYDGVAV